MISTIRDTYRNWDENPKNYWKPFLSAYPLLGNELRCINPSVCKLKDLWNRQFPDKPFSLSQDIYPLLEQSLRNPFKEINDRAHYRGKAPPKGFELQAKWAITLSELSKSGRTVEKTYFSFCSINSHLWKSIGKEPPDWNGRILPKFEVDLGDQKDSKNILREIEKWFCLNRDFNLEISFTYQNAACRLRILKNPFKNEIRAENLKTNARKIICLDRSLPLLFIEAIENKFCQPDIFFIENISKKSAFETFKEPFLLNH